MANYSFTFKEDSLAHHGIEGQKWGVRNGPPYPLKAGDHSPAEKRAMNMYNKHSYKVLKRQYYRNPQKDISKYRNSFQILLAMQLKDHESDIKGLLEDINKFNDKDFPLIGDMFRTISETNLSSLYNRIAKDVLGDYADKPIYVKVKNPGYENGKAFAGKASDILAPAIKTYIDKNGFDIVDKKLEQYYLSVANAQLSMDALRTQQRISQENMRFMQQHMM